MPGRPHPRRRHRPKPHRLAPLAIAAVIALLVSACVNQGVDGDPEAADADAGSGLTDQTDADAVDPAEDAAEDPAEDDASTVDTARPSLPVGAVADPQSLASIESVECDFDEPIPLGVRPVCHLVSVPENWSEPDASDRVTIPVAVFEADGPAGDAVDATVYLDGGPGLATLDLLWTTFGVLHEPQLGRRDYVVFDQRGVGRATPSLACPEVDQIQQAGLLGALSSEEAAAEGLAAIEVCRDRLLADGVDLAAYNSVASANDLEAIRGLLGYEQLNLFGISYGSRLAQSHLRLHPDSVRSVVLDSIVPSAGDLWSTLPADVAEAVGQLFARCAADPTCSTAHPDLEARFFALLDRLDAEPIDVSYRSPLTGDAVEAAADGDALLGLTVQTLYDRASFSLVPSLVAEVEAANYETLEQLGSALLGTVGRLSVGMQLSVACHEEIPFESPERAAAVAPTAPGYERLADGPGDSTIFDQCELWPAGTADPAENELVVSDVPALLLSGGYDPVTRPDNADEVAAGLANHTSLLLPDEGHGIAAARCGAELVAAFFADPGAEIDASCIATSPSPQWVPGAAEPAPIELVEFAVTTPFEVRGLRPDGWIEIGGGVFTRQQTVVDPTSLIVQPTGGAASSFLVELLETQLGVALGPGDPLELSGRAWETFRSDDDPDQVVRLAVSAGADGAVVVLVAPADEIDVLVDQVLVPAIEAVEVG